MQCYCDAPANGDVMLSASGQALSAELPQCSSPEHRDWAQAGGLLH